MFGKKVQIIRKNGKKLVVLTIVVIIAGLGAGFFYYWNYYETPVEKWSDADYSPAEDYKIIENNEGVFVQNKEAGISFKVPDGWRVEKKDHGAYIALLSPEAEDKIFLDKGCKITADVRYVKVNIETIKEVLKEGHKDWGGKDNYEIIALSGYQALKNESEIAKANQAGISIHVPVKKLSSHYVHFVGLMSNVDNLDFCKEVFEDFVKTVSIQ